MFGAYPFGGGYFGESPSVDADALGAAPTPDWIVRMPSDEYVVAMPADDYVVQMPSDDLQEFL